MSRSQLSPEAYARLALEVAREAGAILSAGYRKRPTPTEKAKRDLVTDFDLRSEALIVSRLSAATPELGIIAEEGGGSARPLTWFCDPLDGTTNFVHGHPFWSVSIGLLEEGSPVAGAVVAPALGLSWVAHVGGQAVRYGTPESTEICSVSQTTELERSLVATGFPANRTSEPESNLATFVRVKQVVRGVRRCGSAAIDLCLVADGTYDAYWERRLSAWDLAGGAAILLAAGGKLTALDGGSANLQVGHVIASNGLVHDGLCALVNH